MANDDPKPATDPGTRGSALRKQRIEAAKEAARQRRRELGLPELAEDERERPRAERQRKQHKLGAALSSMRDPFAAQPSDPDADTPERETHIITHPPQH